MKRVSVPPRPGWEKKFEELGFSFHSIDGLYWHEGVAYQFASAEIDHFEEATEELRVMYRAAIQHVIALNLYDRIGISPEYADIIRRSWQRSDPSIYGRFDFAYDGAGEPKLLEYNADTPTSVIESSVAQWVWLEDTFPDYDQFNSIHEKLIDAFRSFSSSISAYTTLYFACLKENEEDFVTTEYIRDTASQARLSTQQIYIEDIGYDSERKVFVDEDNKEIKALFKLYPWEWLIEDEFGKNLIAEPMKIIEPPWKLILSNKAILAILWELYPDHPNLLPTYFDQAQLSGDYVKKPFYSREGSNVTVVRAGEPTAFSTDGTYGKEGFVYQAYHPLPSFDGNYPVVGSWVVDGKPAGLGIREDDTPVTKNTSRFVPHFFIPE